MRSTGKKKSGSRDNERKEEFRLEPDPEQVMKSKWVERLTTEQADKLDAHIRPRKGAPFSLNSEQYFALSDVGDAFERVWYQEKAEKEGLSQRQIEKIIREDLFAKIIGYKRPPAPRIIFKKGKIKPLRDKDMTPEERESYEKLVSDIKTTFDEAEAKGVSIRHHRSDLLECRNCGAFEDRLCGEDKRSTFPGSGKRAAKAKVFQVIDFKERSRDIAGGGTCFWLKYKFVCGVCGAYQSQDFRKIYPSI